MPNRFESRFSISTIARERANRVAALLLALLVTGFAVGTPAQEPDKKPTYVSGADLTFEPLDPDEAGAAKATVVYDFGSADPISAIHNTTEVKIPGTGTFGIAAPYPLNTVISGFHGTVGRIAVRLNNFTHSCPNDVVIVLVGPKGQKVELMGDTGSCNPAEGVALLFEDGAPKVPSGNLVAGTYAPSGYHNDSLPLPAPPAPYLSSLAGFLGTDPNGTWSLYLLDRANEDVGTLSGFTLLISPQLSNNAMLPIPDCGVPACPPGPATVVESPIDVSILTQSIAKVTVSFHITHTWDADLDISLVGPDNTTVPLVEDRGGIAGKNFGTSCANRTVLDDAATTAVGSGSPPFAGTFRPESPLQAFNGKSGAAANGVWKLRIKDDAGSDVGALQCWSITFTEHDFAPRAPTGLRVASIVGNEVTLRWTEPAGGAEPTGYVLEGGLNPGETLASVATNHGAPVYTFVAPSGSFYVRMRTQAADQLGPPSGEIPLHVNVPVPPSPPGLLQGVANGSTLALAWRTAFGGAAPTSYILDVSGDAHASIPLPLTDNITFSGVPAGTYELRLRAANAAGASDPGFTAAFGDGPSTLPLKFTFPSSCSGAPETPSSFLAYSLGNTLYVMWEPPMVGYAPTEYVLNVDGGLVGSVTTTARVLKGTVGNGYYLLSVAARNPCGQGPFTYVRVVYVE